MKSPSNNPLNQVDKDHKSLPELYEILGGLSVYQGNNKYLFTKNRSNTFLTLYFKPDVLYYEKPIKSFKLILDRHPEESCDDSNGYYIEITWRAGEKELLEFRPRDRNAHKCVALFKEMGAKREAALERIGGGVLNWFSRSADSIYSSSASKQALHEYPRLHSTFATVLDTTIKAQEITSARVYAFGTGNGSDLKAVVDTLRPNLSVAGIGFDINSENIATASKLSSDQITFKLGNTLDLITLVKENQNDAIFNSIPESNATKNIFIFSGSVTRTVLRGTADGLRVLQQACRCGDIAIFGGITDVLFTKRVAMRCGWNTDHIGPNLFLLQTPAAEERKIWLLSKINRDCSYLDLSYSSHPLKDLRLLFEANIDLSKVVHINLQYTYMLESEMSQLKEILLRFGNIRVTYNDFNPVVNNCFEGWSDCPEQLTFTKCSQNDFLELPSYSDRFVARYSLHPPAQIGISEKVADTTVSKTFCF